MRYPFGTLLIVLLWLKEKLLQTRLAKCGIFGFYVPEEIAVLQQANPILSRLILQLHAFFYLVNKKLHLTKACVIGKVKNAVIVIC